MFVNKAATDKYYFISKSLLTFYHSISPMDMGTCEISQTDLLTPPEASR